MNEEVPPIAKSQRSGFLDETILNFSSKLFEKPIFGYIIAALYNIFYIYYWYKHINLISIVVLSILYFIIISIIQVKLMKM